MIRWLKEMRLRLVWALTEPRLMQVPKPPKPLRPPVGFRFATNPPSLDDLVRVENDHPYRRARRGEPIDLVQGVVSRVTKCTGRVIGRMGSRDPRANHLGPHSYLEGPEGWPGLWVEWPDSSLKRWIPCQNVWRSNDGRLQYLR